MFILLLSNMLGLLFQLYSFMGMNVDYTKEEIVREAYVEWASDLNGLTYAKGGFLQGGKLTDCSGLFIRFGIMLGLWDNSFRMNHNSFKLYEIGKKIPYDQIRKGDTVFFLPQGSGINHIAMITKPYDGTEIHIIDFIEGKSPKSRILKTYKCGKDLCYNVNGKGNWRLLFSENIFVSKLKDDGKIKDTTVWLPEKSKCISSGCLSFSLFGVHNIIGRDNLQNTFSEIIIKPFVKSLPKTNTSIEGLVPLLDIDNKDAFVNYFLQNTTYEGSGVVYLGGERGNIDSFSNLPLFTSLYYGLDSVKFMLATDTSILHLY